MFYRILPSDDDRNKTEIKYSSGVYMVQKRNIIAKFQFGKNCRFESITQAHCAMNEYLNNRKDSSDLTVTLIGGIE